MFDDSYNEYIRSVLGYPSMKSDIYNSSYDYNTTYRQNTNNSELEDCYPEIYKLVYPMVTKACNSNTENITRDLVERMTDEIYFSIESNNEINVNINLTNEVTNNQSNNRNNTTKMKTETKEIKENRSAKPINRGLRDIIKILILRELLGRPNFPGHRPPVRPPFPGGGSGRPPFPPPRPPFQGGPRPPIMPRIYEDQYNDFL